MYDVSRLPAVRAQLEQSGQADQKRAKQPVEYARAPIATGGQVGAGRPPATQGTTR